jgi:extracellular factor (EF) 3-hydroxypalmitic acid methyl ester biosynthesis protein
MKTNKPLIQESFEAAHREASPKTLVMPSDLPFTIGPGFLSVTAIGNSFIKIQCTEAEALALMVGDLCFGSVIVMKDLVLSLESFDEGVGYFKSNGCFFDLAQVQGLLESHSVTGLLKTELPAKFLNSIFNISGLFQYLRIECIKDEEKLEYLPPSEKASYEETFSNEIGIFLQAGLMKEIVDIFTELRFAQTATITKATAFARAQLVPYLNESVFFSRVFNKPLGYAGDFEVMRQSYRNGFEGKSLFGKCLHRFFMLDPATQSIRNRAEYLCEKIQQRISLAKEGDIVKIASIACGPAFEWEIFSKLSEIPTGVLVQVDLYDQDLVALESAESSVGKIAAGLPGLKVRFLNVAVKNIIQSGFPEKDYDMIYTAGLFDYLQDDVCKRCASRMYEALKPNGLLVIGNESPAFPSIPIMELLLDWHLIYRSPHELLSLFSYLSGIPTIETEKLGINLFFNLIKN